MNENGLPAWEPLSLEVLGDGRAIKLVDYELGRAIQNIRDVNTDPKKTRTVILKLKLQPAPDRLGATVEIEVDSKLAGDMPVIDSVAISPSNDLGYVSTSEQLEIQIADKGDNPTRMVPRENGGDQ